jgi:hypothetical protein
LACSPLQLACSCLNFRMIIRWRTTASISTSQNASDLDSRLRCAPPFCVAPTTNETRNGTQRCRTTPTAGAAVPDTASHEGRCGDGHCGSCSWRSPCPHPLPRASTKLKTA